MRIAVINGATVENIIEAEADFAIPGRVLVAATDSCEIGSTYQAGVFSPPNPTIPDRVSANQFGKQLAAAGLMDQVQAWVAQQDAATKWSFNRSATFVRGDPMMQTGFAALGFTAAQIDQFFIDAAAL